MSVAAALRPDPTPPIFALYSIDEIARRLLLSEIYVAELKTGARPMGPRFRRRAVRAFGQTEQELFGPDAGT